MNTAIIQGFSKLSKSEKIEAIANQLQLPDLDVSMKRYWHNTEQSLFDQFSENTISNFYLPFGIAPNFLINGEVYHIPMVVEESSVVAAASSAAKFWAPHGGFHATVIDTQKVGHVYFHFSDTKNILTEQWTSIRQFLLSGIVPYISSMEARGGGVKSLILDRLPEKPEIYFLQLTVETVNAMGANFINSLLEKLSELLIKFEGLEKVDVIMSILSNYTPDCKVHCYVNAHVSAFNNLHPAMSGKQVANKILTAVDIANADINRAVTHNKGIMNGIDAVVMATGNDFRAVEADAHAYASRSGKYSSLSSCEIKDDVFQLSVEIPLSLGTVGGLTNIHPMTKCSLDILAHPSAKQLMMITATVGLANHFSALRALVTKGIQHGHMKMHLSNILEQLEATEEQKIKANNWFADKIISFNAVREYLNVK